MALFKKWAFKTKYAGRIYIKRASGFAGRLRGKDGFSDFGLKNPQVVEEDQQQHRRADLPQQEDEHAVNAEFQRPVVGDLLLQDAPVEAPADEYAGEESARG